MQPAAVSSVGLVALAGARPGDWAEASVTNRKPYPVKKGGEKQGRRRERRGEEKEAGSGSSARAPSAPVPGLQGAQRAPPRAPATGRPTGHHPPWSLDKRPPRTLHRTLLLTGLDTTTDTTSQLRTSLPAPFPRPWTLSPPPSARAQTSGAPSRLWRSSPCTSALDTAVSRPPSLLSSHLTSLARWVRAPPVSQIPLLLGQRCPPGCLSPGDCGGSSAAVEASLSCTGTTATASLAGTGTKTRTTRPLSYGPRVRRAAGG